jgi:hypothetical protein
MTQEEFKKLRGHYHTLRNQRDVLEDEAKSSEAVDDAELRALAEELDEIEADFPGLLPPFEPDRFLLRFREARGGYSNHALRMYLGRVIAKVETAIDTTESTPVTQKREYPFVADTKLREILERDDSEIQRAYVAQCWKSVIILAGGAIEALLLDRLQQDAAKAKAAGKAPKQPDLTKWDLGDLIAVCVELGFVSSGADKLSHSVREYRNLVHPGNEIRKGLIFDAEEAKIAVEVLNIVRRDLS